MQKLPQAISNNNGVKINILVMPYIVRLEKHWYRMMESCFWC